MTKNHWILIWLKKKLKQGTLRKRSDQMSEYCIVGASNVKNILIELMPFIKIKRHQTKLLLNIIKEMPGVKNDPLTFLTLCEQVDKFANLNASKKRTITAKVVKSELKLKTNLFPVETET